MLWFVLPKVFCFSELGNSTGFAVHTHEIACGFACLPGLEIKLLEPMLLCLRTLTMLGCSQCLMLAPVARTIIESQLATAHRRHP